MKKNQLGTSDLHVSAVTLGCMSLGTDKEKAHKMIDHALDARINHLDTADLYDFGVNEEIVGEAIKEKRDRIILTSKVGNHFNKETRDWYWDPSREHIQNGIRDSLRRLQTDYIDFYMLHGGTIDDPIDETIAAFEELKKEGLIRAYGISSIRPNVIREYVRKSNIDAVMMQYSLLDRRPEEEMLDLLQENGISVLARGPLAKGMLGTDGRSKIEQKGRDGFLDYTYEALKTVHRDLLQMMKDVSSMNALSLGYVLKHPAVKSAVFGASSVEQITENVNADFSEALSDELYRKLRETTKANTYVKHR